MGKGIKTIQIRTARFVFKNWRNILYAIVFLFFLLLLFTLIIVFVSPYYSDTQTYNTISTVISSVSGIATIFGLGASIAVLHAVRNMIPHWTQMSEKFKKQIEDSHKSLYILTANPAFLQAFSEESFYNWVTALEKKIKDKTQLNHVVFAYLKRSILNEKLWEWSGKDNEIYKKFKKQLTHKLIFGWRKDVDNNIKNSVFFIPLDIETLPYFITASDDSRMAIFSRAEIKNNIYDSIIRGFMTEDPSISEAFNEVFRHMIFLNGLYYEYTCDCGNNEKLFDHDLFERELIHIDSFEKTPIEINCSKCKNKVDLIEKKVVNLDIRVRDQLFKNIL